MLTLGAFTPRLAIVALSALTAWFAAVFTRAALTPLFAAIGASSVPEQAPKQGIDGYWMGLAKRLIELI